MRNQFLYGVASIALVASAPALAQETTSSVRGTVSAAGAPVADAQVDVIHEASGTTASVSTNSDGSFSVNGLRVGGPFTVKVTAGGFEDSQVTDVYLSAGQPLRVNVSLEAMKEIVVTASRSGALETSTGPLTAMGRDDIEGVASINRDIRDLARRDPLVSVDLSNNRAMEVAGNNGRLNRFSVDGVQMSDDFGLNNGGLPTSRGPVPLDAVEQFSVKVAPFDIAEGDFQGGAINVVLRSGTNKFKGSAFYSYTDENLTGSKTRGLSADVNLYSKNYGALLSGPIIKDKLFFMVAYEKANDSFPYDSGVGPGVFNQVPGITQAEIDSVTATAKTVYGYDTGGFQPNQPERDEKIIAKLDWNASDDHRVALTYIRNKGSYQVQQNTFLTPVYALGLESNSYVTKELINTGTVEFNSTWSDNFSTTLRGSYRDYNRNQDPVGGRSISNFEVCLDQTSSGSVTSCSSDRLFFGPDVSRHANFLRTSNASVDFTARLTQGNHDLRLIAGYTKVDTYNVFLRRSLGDLYFDSLADFQAQRANRLRLGGAVPSLNAADAAADFKTSTFNFGLQDDWQVTDNLLVTVGARYDVFGNNVAPALNPNFVARYGFTNMSTFKGRDVVQPRFGFNWEASDRLVVKGGFGIFSGGTPDVYLSNVFANTGLLTNAIDIQRNTSANGCNVTGATGATVCPVALNGVTGKNFNSAIYSYLTTNTASLAQAPTDVIDPNLKLARKWKASLQADYEANLGPLGDGWLIGLQFLYDKNIYGYQWTDIRSVANGTLPDGRTRYGPIGGASTTNRDLMLTNSKQGRAFFYTARFAKSWDSGFSIDGSYTRSNVKDVANLTSSTSSSNYGNNAFSDPNFPAYGRSIYEYTNQWKFGVDFKREFFGDNKTRIGLFGEIRSGRPYSLTMLENTGGRGSAFGTVGNLGAMLLYVPTTTDTKVSFDSAASETAFNALVTSLGIEKYRGKIIAKNTQTSPRFFKLDMHVSQEVPLVKGSKLELFADIENVLNLIDSDWGSLRQVEFPYNAPLVRVACLSAAAATGTAGTFTSSSAGTCAQYRYSNVLAPSEVVQVRRSLYGIRIGAKISF
ncbi:MAG: carboxypeptidase regulatory-like domain-containing protein [Sphingomonadales bacterium]|nr:carboxypeptidase regulatory-like domain-containing protein [Sphingomonadales bacterium]